MHFSRMKGRSFVRDATITILKREDYAALAVGAQEILSHVVGEPFRGESRQERARGLPLNGPNLSTGGLTAVRCRSQNLSALTTFVAKGGTQNNDSVVTRAQTFGNHERSQIR